MIRGREKDAIESKVDKRTALGIMSLGFISFSGIVSETSMNVTFPKLMSVFNISLNTVQGLTTFYLLDVAIIMTLSSFLKQRFLERQLFFIAMSSFFLGTFLCILSINFPMLLVGRIFQGISTGIGTPLLFNVILERIPHRVLGLWMGIGSLIISIAPSIGPTYGGLLVGTVGWRWIFIFLLVLPTMGIFLGIFNLENSVKKKEIPKLDIFAFLLLAITLSSFILGINSLDTGTVNFRYFLLFIVALTCYILRSLTTHKSFLNVRIFVNPFFSFSLLIFGIYQFLNLAVNFIIPNFLQSVQGSTSLEAGFAMLPGTLIGAILNPQVGRLYDRKGPNFGIIAGNFLLTLSLLFFVFKIDTLTFVPIIFAYTGFIVGRNFPMNTVITNTLDKMSLSTKADANAFFQTTNQFFGSMGTAVASLVATNANNLKIGTYHLFILLLVFALFNFFAVLPILKRRIPVN